MYLLTIGLFSVAPISLTILVNDEPILTLTPSPSHSLFLTNAATNATHYLEDHIQDHTNNLLPSNQPLLIRSDTQHYSLHRKRHSLGEVTSVSLSEYIALPPSTSLSVRISCGSQCQGFLSLAKL